MANERQLENHASNLGVNSLHVCAGSPYDNYTCSSCSKRFPWNTMMYGCRECDYDVCGRCINKLYPAPGTIVVQKNVEARKQALKSPGSDLDGIGGGIISHRQRTTSHL